MAMTSYEINSNNWQSVQQYQYYMTTAPRYLPLGNPSCPGNEFQGTQVPTTCPARTSLFHTSSTCQVYRYHTVPAGAPLLRLVLLHYMYRHQLLRALWNLRVPDQFQFSTSCTDACGVCVVYAIDFADTLGNYCSGK